MTDVTALVQTALKADSTLTTLLSGGIYTKRELGKQGFRRENTVCASAWTTSNGFPILQPSLIVRQRGAIPTYQVSDVGQQAVSVRQVVECWFYDDNVFTTIESARDRVYALLHGKTFANVGQLYLVNQLDDMRADELDGAAMLRSDFAAGRVQGV